MPCEFHVTLKLTTTINRRNENHMTQFHNNTESIKGKHLEM